MTDILPRGFCDVYPCGCIYRWNGPVGYEHWVSPLCALDSGKTSITKGYRYLPWYLLPVDVRAAVGRRAGIPDAMTFDEGVASLARAESQ